MDPANYEENLKKAEEAAQREIAMRAKFDTAEPPKAKPVGALMEHDLAALLMAIRNGELDFPEFYKK